MSKSDNINTDQVAALLEQAALRARMPAADEQQVRAQLFSQWDGVVHARRRRKRFVVGGLVSALAASLVLVVSFVLQTPGLPSVAAPLAAVEKQLGGVVVASHQGAEYPLAAEHLTPGAQVRTGEGAKVSLRWADKIDFRLDQNTAIRLTDEHHIELLQGRVYIDTRGSVFDLQIATPLGLIEHIGTRYLVTASEATAGSGQLEVTTSVRSGRVRVQVSGAEYIAERAEQLVQEAGGKVSRFPQQIYGDRWNWIEQIAPSFDADGRTIDEFLQWVAGQTGREVRFGSSTAELTARHEAIIGGKVDRPPLLALELMATTDFHVQLSDGVIHVSLRE